METMARNETFIDFLERKTGVRRPLIVLDTSVLIENPEYYCEDGHEFYVPRRAVKQLDGLQRSEEAEIVKRATRALKVIKDLNFPILDNKGYVNVLDNYGDNEIVGTALRLKKDNPGRRVLVYSSDVNMRIVARTYGLEAIGLNDRSAIADETAQWGKEWEVLKAGTAPKEGAEPLDGRVTWPSAKLVWGVIGVLATIVFLMYLVKEFGNG